jgi:hypothetical protein
VCRPAQQIDVHEARTVVVSVSRAPMFAEK